MVVISRVIGLTLYFIYIKMPKSAYQTLKEKVVMSKLPVSTAFLNRDLSDPELVQEIIHKGSSYQVIPASRAPFIPDPESLIVQIITENATKLRGKLLDISFPFHYPGGKYESGCYFGRYLIFDRKIIGVRLNCSTSIEEGEPYKSWHAGKWTNWKPSEKLVQCYKGMGFTEDEARKEVKVGDFALSFNNVRIGLFFDGQISSTVPLVNLNNQINCEIFSVVADKRRENFMASKLGSTNYQLETSLEHPLKFFAKENSKVVMYSGCKIATPDELFLSTSFIAQSSSFKANNHFLGNGQVLSTVIKIQRSRRQNKKDVPGSKPKAIHILEVNARLPEVPNVEAGLEKRNYPFGQEYKGPIPDKMTGILEKMQLWSLHHSVNKKNPFILPLPLDPFSNSILTNFRQICDYNQRSLDEFLMFYKTAQNAEMLEDVKATCFESLDELLMKRAIDEPCFIYTDNQEEGQKVKRILSKNEKVYLCNSSIMRGEEEKSMTLEQESVERKMNLFCEKIISEKLFTMKQIFQENKGVEFKLTRDQLTTAIAQNMKILLRNKFKSHPFYSFIISSNRHKIAELLQEQYSIDKKLKDAENKEKRQASEQMNNTMNSQKSEPSSRQSFISKLSSLNKIFSEDRSGILYQCHRCPKKLPLRYIYHCKKCSIRTCYLCCDEMGVKLKKGESSIEECVVCSKKCYCEQCNQRKKGSSMRQTRAEIELVNQTLSIENMVDENEEKKVVKIWEKDECQKCLIEGRPKMMIKIVCCKCEGKDCFHCVKSRENGRKSFLKEWLCDECKPEHEKRRNLEMNPMSMINENPEIEDQEDYVEPQQMNPAQKRRSQRKHSPSRSHSPQLRRKKSVSHSISPARGGVKGKSPSHSPSPARGIRKSPSHSPSPVRGIAETRKPESPQPRKSSPMAIRIIRPEDIEKEENEAPKKASKKYRDDWMGIHREKSPEPKRKLKPPAPAPVPEYVEPSFQQQKRMLEEEEAKKASQAEEEGRTRGRGRGKGKPNRGRQVDFRQRNEEKPREVEEKPQQEEAAYTIPDKYSEEQPDY